MVTEIMTEMVKSDSKKNIVKNQNLGESLNVLVPKEEPKDEYGELEQIPGSSFGAVSIQRDPKEEYSEVGTEAGGVCKVELELELELRAVLELELRAVLELDLELDLVRWVKQAVTSESPPMMQKPAGLVTQFYGLDSKSR